MMNRWKNAVAAISCVLILGVVCTVSVTAAGPPLKENPCSLCHKDFKAIAPKGHPDVGDAAAKSCLTCHAPDTSRTEATKFSTMIHKTHKEGGKTTLECGACHAL